MARKKLNKKIEADILKQCRRRCCICYGLNRDTGIKQGQIAHLDKNPNNNNEKNLVFLCLKHHDQYDSTTSQSKNLTKHEVIDYKRELIESIDHIWKTLPSFEDVQDDGPTNIEGHYIQTGSNTSSELDIQLLDDGSFQVRGIALWGTTDERGPNIGVIDFKSELNDGILIFNDKQNDEEYELVLSFKGNKIIAKEKNFPGYFGMNVSFQGEYKRAIDQSE